MVLSLTGNKHGALWVLTAGQIRDKSVLAEWMMSEPDERWLNDANVIRLLLGVVGFCIGAWLLSQQLTINAMSTDIKVIELNTAGLGELAHNVARLRDAHEDDAKAFAALKTEADDTKAALEKLVDKKQYNLLEKKYERKAKQDNVAMELQQKHSDHEIQALTELHKRDAARP
jgi:hypothetical protein